MPNSVVLNKATAEKFFGTANPIGKTVSMENGQSFMVTGVLKESPGKLHISFDAFASYASVKQMEKDKVLPDKTGDWYAFNTGYTYVLLKKKTDISMLKGSLQSEAAELNRNNKDGNAAFNVQPVDKITPADDNLYNDIGGGTSWTKLYAGIIVALIILISACFNYTNLTIARALTKAKEVGIRKVVGAKQYQVFTQYVVESVLLAFFALGFAWILLSFIIQYAPFNDDYEMIPSGFKYNTPFALYTLDFALFTGLVAGIVPAWILSSFKPVKVLKNLITAKIYGKIGLQKTLIVFQYSLSLFIIIFLLAFYRQFSFMSSADPGFKKDNVMVLPLDGLNEGIVSQKIIGLSGVKSVSAMSSNFQKHFSGTNTSVWLANKQEAVSLNYYYADEPFLPSMKLSMLAGNNFPAGSENDSEHYIILNEKAANTLGFKNYSQAIGQKLWINDSTQLQIAGVLKDFNYENAGVPVKPLAFRNKKDADNYLYITTTGADKQALTNRIEQAWNPLAPTRSFSYSWLDEDLDKNNSQSATISLLSYLAFMAVAIASLGLLGLVIYTVEVKRKEISIRKIIGADKKQLVLMLSKRFIKLLFIAGLIAMPLGYTAGFLFLQNFLNRINFGVFSVLLCFLFLLSIGLITIISQTYKAATENPVKSLRTE